MVSDSLLPEEAVRQAHGEGTRRWPGVEIPFDAFAAHVREVRVRPGDLVAHGAELYLAVACVLGDPSAQTVFDRVYLMAVPRHVARFSFDGAQLDELVQVLRIKLLNGPRPRIASYGGRAPLDAWVRVAAVRAALDLVGSEKSWALETHQPAIAALIMTEADPELIASKANLRKAFQTALEQSLVSLHPRDQLLLRMQVVEGLGIDALARLFHVHRATVARWLVQARNQVFDGVRARLGLRRRPTSSEFRSLVRLVKDDLTISVDRVLPARG